MGMAIFETIAEVCRNHPNIIGIAAGVLVERFLVAEKKHHEERLVAATDHHEQQTQKAKRKAAPKPLTRADIRRKKSKRLKPLRLAFEVLGALIVLKLANSSTRFFSSSARNNSRIFSLVR